MSTLSASYTRPSAHDLTFLPCCQLSLPNISMPKRPDERAEVARSCCCLKNMIPGHPSNACVHAYVPACMDCNAECMVVRPCCPAEQGTTNIRAAIHLRDG